MNLGNMFKKSTALISPASKSFCGALFNTHIGPEGRKQCV